MKKIKIILVTISMILSTFAISAAAEAILSKSEQKNITKEPQQRTLFDAEITFYVYEGEGCACKPIVGAKINATSGDGEDSGLTDTEGKCILHMVINSEYLVWIEAQDFNTIRYNFDVIDDQTFKFHMGEKNHDSSHNIVKVISGEIKQILQEKLRFVEGKNLVVK